MLIPQSVDCESNRGHGGLPVSFEDLRRRLNEPSSMGDGHRQRLLEFQRRAARVQALGGEYAGVQVSEYVRTATDCRHAVT